VSHESATLASVTIEALAPEYFDQVARWLSDPRINAWLSSEWRNRAIDKALIAVVVRNTRNQLFLVRSRQQPCGFVALSDIDAVDGIAMVWYGLGEQALGGQGITSEAVRQLTHYAFSKRGLQSLYAWTMANNGSSGRVLVNAGFRHAGRLRNAASSQGRPVDRIYYDLIAADSRR